MQLGKLNTTEVLNLGASKGCCFVLFYEMVSQTWPQETEERVGETIFILVIGPRDKRHNMPHRATWENTRMVRRQKIVAEEVLRQIDRAGVSRAC